MVLPVKVFFLLLFFTLGAHAAATDPGKVAIEFLEKVRDGKVNLEPGGDTAMSPQTAVEKRRQIAKRLERVAQDLGRDPLEVGAVQLDENFAAVLIRKVGGFDASRLQVFPVALVKKDEQWEAAPLLASFENSGAGYAVSLRKRIEELENWMLREQVLDLEKLREQSKALLKTRIESRLSSAEFGKFGAKEIGERFVTACESGDLPSLLGVLGGLGTKLPDNWTLRLKSAENAISAGASAARPWRLMVAPGIARVLVHDETNGDTGLISIACLDPADFEKKSPHVELLHFELSRSAERLWRIDPPPAFLEKANKATTEEMENSEGEDSNPDIANRFPAIWMSKHPAAPQPTAELASRNWLSALNGGNFVSFLAITRLEGADGASLKSCIKSAKTWGAVRNGSAELALPLAFKAEANSAVGIYQFLSTKDSEILNAQPVFFEKSPHGWLWTPEPTDATRASLMPWVADQSRNLPNTWQQIVLSGSPIIASVDGLESVSEEVARNCVQSWLNVVRRSDGVQALSQTARLETPRSAAVTLQNLGYEIADSRRSSESPSIISVNRAGPWTTVGVKIIRGSDKPIYPLYTVIKTAQGPRILAEADLFASDNRSRDFLNNEVLKRIMKATSAEAASELRKLLEIHKTAIGGNPKK